MRNNRDRYGHVYIFLIRKQNQNDLVNVRSPVRRLSVRKTCAKASKRIKIIACEFFCLKNRNSEIFEDEAECNFQRVFYISGSD